MARPASNNNLIGYLLGCSFACRLSICSIFLVFALIMVFLAPAAAQTCQPDGDVNGSGTLTGADVRRVLQHILRIADPPLDDCELNIADVSSRSNDPDINVTAADVRCILQEILRLPSCFDVPAGNRAPVAEAVSLQTDLAIPYVEQQLIGTDPDNDTLTFELISPSISDDYDDAYLDPQSGILYLTLAAGASELVELDYRVTDGQIFSEPASVRIRIERISRDQGLGALEVEAEEYAEFESLQLSADVAGSIGADSISPSWIDLSANFPVPGNQGSQGSCVGWATAYAAKTYHERLEMSWPLLGHTRLFSPAYIYNQLNRGKDEGMSINAALDLIVKQGVATMAAMPYDSTDYLRQPSTKARRQAANFKAQRSYTVKGVRRMKAALANKHPVIISMKVYPSFRLLKGRDSVYNSATGKVEGLHAVTIVGYNDNRYGGAFQVINSWGRDAFGDNGYFWLPYDFVIDVVREAYVLIDGKNGAGIPAGPWTRPPNPDLPNLQVQQWNASYDPRPGGLGVLEYSVINTGTGVAPTGVTVALMLSTDPAFRFGSQDVLVVEEKIPFPIEPGRGAIRDETNAIRFFPEHLQPGMYLMALTVNLDREVEESDESDNVNIMSGEYVVIEDTQPDLYVRNWHAEWSLHSPDSKS